MLRIYRRHLKKCPHKSMTYRRCTCPVWMFGSVRGKRVRRALDTTSWTRGEEILRELDPDESPEKVTIEIAGERFIADCKSRNLAHETIGKYRLLNREMKAFLHPRISSM